MEGFVYFCTDGEAIKIGKTKNQPFLRIKALNTNYYKEFILLGYIISDKYSELEKEIHELLKINRLKGEWFNISKEFLKEFVKHKNYKYINFDYVNKNVCEKHDEIQIPKGYILFQDFCLQFTFLSEKSWRNIYKKEDEFKACTKKIGNLLVVSPNKVNNWIASKNLI